MGKQVTLQDIANEADCSLRIVSAVLNHQKDGPIHYSEELADKIWEIVKRTGYVVKEKKEKPAASLRKYKIICVFEHNAVTFQGEISKQLMDSCQLLGIEPVLHFCDRNADRKEELTELAASLSARAVLSFHNCSSPVQELLKQGTIPVLIFNPQEELPRNCCLLADAESFSSIEPFLPADPNVALAYVEPQQVEGALHHSVPARREAVRLFARKNKMPLLYDGAGKPVAEQVEGVFAAAQTGQKLLVFQYCGHSELEALIAARLAASDSDYWPGKLDFFSLDEANDFSFAWLEYDRGLMIRALLEELMVMMNLRILSLPNLIYHGRIRARRCAFAT